VVSKVCKEIFTVFSRLHILAEPTRTQMHTSIVKNTEQQKYRKTNILA